MKTLIYLLAAISALFSLDLKSQVPQKPFASFSFENDYYDYPEYEKDKYLYCYVDEQNGSDLFPKLNFDRGSRALLFSKGDGILELPLFDFIDFKQVDLSFDLGSYSTLKNDAPDKSDPVELYVMIDGYKKKCLEIIGETDQKVGIEEGDTCVSYYNSSCKHVSIKDSKGPHTHFVLKNLPIKDLVYITFKIKTNLSSECWIIDNIEFRGTRNDSWGNYTSSQIQSIESHKANNISIIGDWSAEQVDKLTESLKPIIPTLREIDIVNANFAADANIKSLFDGANQLCNIYACDMLPQSFDGVFKGINPNCLLHTNELAPQQGVNIIKGNYADAISLVDKSACRFDRQVKFHKVSFVKTFPKEIESGYKDETGGWQTISLPFYAERFYALDRGGAEMKPFFDKEFDYDNYLPFWIKNTSVDGDFQIWNRIGPNYPYIVSVPNNDVYQDKYRIWGRVSFENTDGYIWPTGRSKDKTMGKFTFHPNVEGETFSQNIYTLNEEGSAFILTSDPLSPFSSCLLFNGPQEDAPKRVDIMNDGAIVSSILKDENIVNSELEISQVGTYLKISSCMAQKVRIYNLQGILVKTLLLRANQEQYVDLAPGLYLINDKKAHVF